MNTNLVSVIVPCYNQAEYLDEALTSVLEQTYTHWECIIINDGSVDNTKDLAAKWVENDNRFIYIEQQNKGLSEARNSGIRVTKGFYILPLDADDKVAPNYIALGVQEFLDDKSLKVVYCQAEFFGAKTGLWNLPEYTFNSLLQSNKIFCTALFKRDDWEKIGGYDSNMKYGLEDWEFWINLLKRGGNVKKLEMVGFYYRVKEGSMIKSMTPEQVSYSNNYVLQKHSDVYIKTYNKLLEANKNLEALLRSRKHALNLLIKRVFGFHVFKQ
ncbi:glycosyltransferase family 2 protein [Formosa maritima]|uniref:Glycosyltransferase family 2 protein n=1 Tax=Formosa maritima TaxID=2592046 RepID=A0A5D0GCB1_9FLAO|nr:glycosyltransferase family A protein [Formosa maritima]TYA56653.1 glycosyltransferase family 2 protein [Formosa maritima]